MNEKNKIEIDQSSLLSLKTELLKKKAEALSSQSNIEIKAKAVHKTKKISKNDSGRKEKDSKIFEHDDSSQFDKVKKTLEAKAKFYDKMQSSGQNTALILFKNRVNTKDPAQDDDYIEFTDCFGRTRNLSKEEYNEMKRQQAKEKEDMSDNDERIEETVKVEQEVGENFRKQREIWLTQEKINSEQNEIFYQDILFDEAREHGTAYYQFSTDHAEREEQQDRFKRMREDTEKAQSERNVLKKHRDEIIKNRVAQAKARIRQKMGLPAESESPESKEEQSEDISKQVPEPKINETELEKERLRKEYVRPWDRNKLGEKRSTEDNYEDEWVPKREKFLMSQEEWVDKQRQQRDKNFAPIYNLPSSSKHCQRSKDVEKDIEANLKFIRKKFD